MRSSNGRDSPRTTPSRSLVPSRLPLKENDWNHIRVALAGDRMALFVNGTQVAETDIHEPRERRNLGLFRFANRQNCRVRNFIYRGHWPMLVPPVNEQELGSEQELGGRK